MRVSSHSSLFFAHSGSRNKLLICTLPQLKPFFEIVVGLSISGMLPWLADFPGFSLVFDGQEAAGSDTEMSESLFEIACSEAGWIRGSVDNAFSPFLLGHGSVIVGLDSRLVTPRVQPGRSVGAAISQTIVQRSRPCIVARF
jgi:hypothetical protein